MGQLGPLGAKEPRGHNFKLTAVILELLMKTKKKKVQGRF